MNKELVKKSQEISYLLRHHPEEYCLNLMTDGSVCIDEMIMAINAKHHKGYLSREDIDTIIRESDKKRFEIKGDLIRAMYGHSTKHIDIVYEPSTPPSTLYHGTTTKAYELIKHEGIKKMKRQYVHLSETPETAVIVANRHKNKEPALLYINAERMRKDGIKFYQGNDKVWLTDYVNPKYIYMVTIGIEKKGE